VLFEPEPVPVLAPEPEVVLEPAVELDELPLVLPHCPLAWYAVSSAEQVVAFAAATTCVHATCVGPVGIAEQHCESAAHPVVDAAEQTPVDW
jgi:hypothetical protein